MLWLILAALFAFRHRNTAICGQPLGKLIWLIVASSFTFAGLRSRYPAIFGQVPPSWAIVRRWSAGLWSWACGAGLQDAVEGFQDPVE